MAIKELRKAAGIYTNSNSLGSFPEGAMLEATNVVIDKDDIVESRRGFKVYGDAMGSVGDRAKQLLPFQDRVLRHYSDLLQHETIAVDGTFETYKQLNFKYATTLTSSSTTATFNSDRPHGLTNGDSVVISGATDDAYNGTFVAAVVDSDTFTYTMSASGASPASGDAVMESSTAHISQVDSDNRIRGAETPNGSFFFTSDTGIKKLDDADTFIRDAGGIKALDLELTAIPVVNAEVLPQNSQLGYRTLWGYKDLNNVLVLGTPSTRSTIGLTVSSLITPDFNTLLTKLDAAAAVNSGTLQDTNYNTLAISTSATAAQLNAGLKSLCSKLELDMGFVFAVPAKYGRSGSITSTNTGSTITITTTAAHQLTTGDEVTIANSNAVPSIDGKYSITRTGASTFTINVITVVTVAGATVGTWQSGIAQDYAAPTTNLDLDFVDQQVFFDEIVNLLLTESIANITVVAQTAGAFTTSTQAESVHIKFTVPENVTPSYFYQIYRTTASLGSDVDPGDDMGLVYEANPTAAEIQQGFVEVDDDTPDEFRGAALYTNPRQEGILQANEPPPFAKDLALFQNCMFYGNTHTPYKLSLNLLGTNNLSGTKLQLAAVTYTFAATEDTTIGQVKVFTTGTAAQNLDNTARSLVKVINRYTANNQVYAYYLSQADQIPGQLSIEARTLEIAKFYALSNSVTVGAVNYSPSIAPENNAITAITAGPNSVITTTSPHGLAVGSTVILAGTNNNIDGSYLVNAKTSTTFTITRAGITAAGTVGAFKNAANANGASDNEVAKNRLYYSKQQQYEAAPLLNYFDVGSGDKEIIRLVPLRDSLFVLKEDGVYRVTGSGPSSFAVSIFDNTTIIIGSDTATIGNNQVYCFSNQGIVTISDTGVSIISRPIENQILPLAAHSNIKSKAFGVFYQTDRKYILSMPMLDTDTVSTIQYIYNNITNCFTNWDLSKTCGLVNPRDDKLYFGAGDIDFIEEERKDFARTDFSDREYDLTVTTYDSATFALKLSSVDEAAIGDVVVQTQTHTNAFTSYDIEVEAIITEVDTDNGSVIVATSQYDFVAGPITLYKAFEAKVLWVPETADGQGTMKQFREAILRLKKSRVSTPYLGFSSNLQPSFEEIAFSGPGLGLWGYFPWGSVPWGGDSNQRAFRTYVPLQKQRCSMLNVFFKHKVAREEWQVEGLALVYEVYSSKVNR
jgi:hypothetical protein